MNLSPSGRLSARDMEPFGVRVEGDLSQEPGPADRAWLAALLDRDGLIVAAGQAMSRERQLSLMESFGPVLGGDKDLAYVVAAEGVLASAPLAFHSDMAFTRSPYLALSLHAVDVADGESCTRFASGMAAYDRLSAAQRDRLEGLTATWVSSHADRRMPHDYAPDAFRHSRPPVIAHPRTARPILYVNEGQTARFEEMDRDESIALLDELFAVLYAPDAVYRHDWRMGDIVIWDNIAIQHGRPPLEGVSRRKLQRASVATETLFEMHPDFRVEAA